MLILTFISDLCNTNSLWRKVFVKIKEIQCRKWEFMKRWWKDLKWGWTTTQSGENMEWDNIIVITHSWLQWRKRRLKCRLDQSQCLMLQVQFFIGTMRGKNEDLVYGSFWQVFILFTDGILVSVLQANISAKFSYLKWFEPLSYLKAEFMWTRIYPMHRWPLTLFTYNLRPWRLSKYVGTKSSNFHTCILWTPYPFIIMHTSWRYVFHIPNSECG